MSDRLCTCDLSRCVPCDEDRLREYLRSGMTDLVGSVLPSSSSVAPAADAPRPGVASARAGTPREEAARV